jgi:hypothetical protein
MPENILVWGRKQIYNNDPAINRGTVRARKSARGSSDFNISGSDFWYQKMAKKSSFWRENGGMLEQD